MFGFGKSTNHSAHAPTHARKLSRDSTAAKSIQQPISFPESLEPAIEGPPSPERIRAYTEQMKRSSIFGSYSRTQTISSAASSFRSRDSSSIASSSTNNLSLSRHSSGRSNAGSMASRLERPESVHLFGKTIFSRGGRKAKRESSSLSSMSSMSIGLGGVTEEGSARNVFYGHRVVGANTMTGPRSSKEPQSRHRISRPYNFQHVTHTRQDHLPNLQRTSRMELVSEFSAIRASQAPTNGELKGIRAQDLHFENFSSEALNAGIVEDRDTSQERSPQQRVVMRTSVSPPQPHRAISHSRSHDNLRASPTRPPRSPQSPTCPVALPARTSSRTASALFGSFDMLATTTIERPQTTGGFRKPTPFSLASPPPRPPPLDWSQGRDSLPDEEVSHALTTPGDEAWPLTASTVDTFAGLSDVPEEEEHSVLARRSRISFTGSELKTSKSVPALRLRSQVQTRERSETGMSSTSGTMTGSIILDTKLTPKSPTFQLGRESWEADIDYCYEHEAEANCDYQWERCSMDDNTPRNLEIAPSTDPSEPVMGYHLENSSDRAYHGRYRPSLDVPSLYEDLPELSPMSNFSTAESVPRTPATFVRPLQLRSPSRASSFKESHGFNLSPTLLIPSDFGAQMDQESIYEDFMNHPHDHSHSSSATIFPAEPYNSQSPIDESTSSTASFRSSNFSRESPRSSASTRISGFTSHERDSVLLVSQAASVSQAHRSVGSNSSLPDLIPSSKVRKEELKGEVSLRVGGMTFTTATATPEVDAASAPAPEINGPNYALANLQHRRNRSLMIEQSLRKAVGPSGVPHNPNHANHFPPASKLESDLSPVVESFAAPSTQIHGRKVSAPVVSPTVKEFKGRKRSGTSSSGKGKSRASYMLFPNTDQA